MFDSGSDFNPMGGQFRRGAAHPNPMFDYTTSFVPRKLKDLFKWAEYLAFNSAHIYAVVRKFGEYPITRFIYESNSEEEKNRHKRLFEDEMHLKGFMTLASYDVWLYGNCFVSVYEPIKRELQCPHCKNREDITAAKYEFNLDKLEFQTDCRNEECGRKGVVAKVLDSKIKEETNTKIRLIRWDPKLIDIEHNPITDEAVYYYQIPRDLIAKVRGGNKTLINHMPIEILRSMQENRTFKFGPDALFHLKMPGPAGVQAQWGYPPITSAIKNFLFAAILRKANEAIALEHIVPFRIIHPLQAITQGDPISSIPLDEWRDKLMNGLKNYRNDPLYIQFAPTPVGVQNVGGEGRAMLTLGELQEAEKAIVLSLGVPMEFLTGGLGQTRGEITLRMIENQLQTHIESLNSLVRWIEKKVASYMGWAPVQMRLADFKMIDDMDNKQLKMNSGLLSESSLAELLDIDQEHERKQKREDTLANMRAEQQTNLEVQKIQNSLSQQAQQQSLQGQASNDPQAVIARADQMAQEFAQFDAGTRRSRMDALKGEDYLTYCVVRDRTEQMQQDQMQAQRAQQKQEAVAA